MNPGLIGFTRAFFAVLFVFFAAGACASAGGATEGGVSRQVRLLRIHNQTGATLKYLFVSPSDSDFWGPDALGSSTTLRSGQSAGFYLHYPEACGNFDILGIHEDNRSFRINAFEVCDSRENQSVALQAEHSAGEQGALRFARLRFRNEASDVIRLLFVSPNDSKAWGVDYLGQAATLARGATIEWVIPVSTQAVRYNVMAADQTDRQYIFNIDVDRSNPTFTFAIEDSDRRR